MIKFSLHPSQVDDSSFAPHLVSVPDELVMINEMIDEGLDVHARTFTSPKGENVTVFWTDDTHGHIATVWEHTFQTLTFNAPPVGLADESAVLVEEEHVNGAHSATDAAEYAVGE